MNVDVDTLYRDLETRALRYGIRTEHVALKPDTPGEFNGLVIRLNRDYDPIERAFYLAHSIGSIAEWSLHHAETAAIFAELRQAKKNRTRNQPDFDRALEEYLAFEQRTWEFAVWNLEDLGHSAVVPAFTNFGRADMESMRLFHATGKAPVWRDFFVHWNDEVRSGSRIVPPFATRPIPLFRAQEIPRQEIVQEDGD
jgi:hypothetical protein